MDLFEIAENEKAYQEVCSKLKNHPFDSPWNRCFYETSKENFITEVFEFFIDSNNVMDLDDRLDTTVSRIQSDIEYIRTQQKSNHSFDEVKVCKLKESLFLLEENSTFENIKELDILFSISPDEIPKLIQMLNIPDLTETSVTLLLNAILNSSTSVSVSSITVLIQHILCPIIFEIHKNNARSIMTTILKFSEMYPKTMIDEVLVPCSQKEPLDMLLLEILLQMTKTHLPNEYISYTLKTILEKTAPNENVFALLQCLLERKVHHEQTLYEKLFSKLLEWAPYCHQNIKYTRLLICVLSIYGSEINSQQLLICESILKHNKTIVKRAAENLLKKLKSDFK